MFVMAYPLQVFMREYDRWRLGLWTDIGALFLLIVPHLFVAAVLAALVSIPMCNLNSSSAPLVFQPPLLPWWPVPWLDGLSAFDMVYLRLRAPK